MGSFFASERLEDDLRWREDREKRLAKKQKEKEDEIVASTSALTLDDPTPVTNETDEFKERDDEDLYFAPEKGNVLFASAVDGWAFRVSQFAHLHAVRLGIREANLTKVLWGDFYLDPKTKRVITRKTLGKRALKPLFVQLVLENIWAVYDSVVLNKCVELLFSSCDICSAMTHSNAEKIGKIVTALGLKIKPQDMRSKDARNLLVAIFSQWLPLAPATFRAIVDRVPPPADAQATRIPKMLHPDLPHSHEAPQPANDLERDLYSANTTTGASVVAYVSKMFAVPSRDLPHNQRRQLTAEEMRERGRILRAAGTAPTDSPAPLADTPVRPKDEEPVEVTGETLIGFSRLYSGVLRVGQSVYCVLPKYGPTSTASSKHVVVAKLTALYMLMGRELVAVDEVPAGNVFGACGLEGKVLRNATICLPPGVGEASMERIEADGASFVNLAGFRLAVRRPRWALKGLPDPRTGGTDRTSRSGADGAVCVCSSPCCCRPNLTPSRSRNAEAC